MDMQCGMGPIVASSPHGRQAHSRTVLRSPGRNKCRKSFHGWNGGRACFFLKLLAPLLNRWTQRHWEGDLYQFKVPALETGRIPVQDFDKPGPLQLAH
ncbi:hypothetical protein ABIE13_002411 [Ottowia thiooxydans]|uniref:Uncharacterized protein n=1 Tax=Ottowia thiooxydans TaxID=219182 RepID=A0ABV2Q8G5_9BURK